MFGSRLPISIPDCNPIRSLIEIASLFIFKSNSLLFFCSNFGILKIPDWILFGTHLFIFFEIFLR